MSDEYPAVDQYGNRGTFRRSGGGDGCLGSPLLLVGVVVIAILIGICAFFAAVSNYFTYHIFTSDTGQAQQLATATVAAPFHFELDALTAQRSGNTSVISNPSGYSQGQGVQLAIGGSVTFHVNIPEAGLYYLCASGTNTRIDITPVSQGPTDIVYDIIVNGKLHDQVDTHDAYWYGIGSKSPNSCINDSPIQLNSGANTIQIKLDEKTQCATFACPGLFVQSISLDKKFD